LKRQDVLECSWVAWPGVARLCRIALIPVGLSLTGGGCRDGARPADKAGISKTARSDSVTLTATATPADVELSQHVMVDVEVIADEGVGVSIENYGHALTEGDRTFRYRVVGSSEKLNQPAPAGKRRWFYGYEIEFFLAEQYELPPAKVSVAKPPTDRGGTPPEGDVAPETETLVTEPLTITVRAPAGATPSADDLRHIHVLDPVELPTLWRRWGWLAVLAAILIAALAIGWLRRRRKGEEALVVLIPAHEWAYAELARLIAEDLVGRSLMQEFFYRISDIVRGYVERRFDLRAPEMTTEEFLIAAASDPQFGREHTEELSHFLNECDLVKYARHEPTVAECNGVLQAARRFIERTRERLFAPAAGTDRPVEEKAA